MRDGRINVWIKAVVLGLLALSLGTVATARLAAQEPSPLEVVALLEQAPGNVAVTAGGRIIVSQHQFYDPIYRVVEVMGDGSTQPFPNEAWASAPGPDGRGMVAVLGIRADPAGMARAACTVSDCCFCASLFGASSPAKPASCQKFDPASSERFWTRTSRRST